MSTYLNTLLGVGFVIDRLVEPEAPVPMILLVSCRRAA
jgi:hypothetical protein